ncbi:MAG: ferritin-like domain-containing protein [Gemmatimonadaceae bacterium]|nr:ferritin-like domain-containing protein [Gemmatimonadaceae bacterium]
MTTSSAATAASPTLVAQIADRIDPRSVTAGDKAILRFLAAAELIEDDLWQQYAELANDNPEFNAALRRIDPALVRYVNDDRDDERSHAQLINAFLAAIGEAPVNLDAFRTLPSVDAQGAAREGRLTTLTNLTVDTSWYTRYRGAGNPDFDDAFAQIVTITNRPTVPTPDVSKRGQVQAAAHAAAFHFAAIEQGGGSLYASLMPKVTSLDVLRILASIGPTEVYHFAAFHKSLEGIFGLTAGDGLVVPDLRNNRALAEAIFPEPCRFLRNDFPLCSVIRPIGTAAAGAQAAATGLVQSGLFGQPGQPGGQSPAFFDAVVALAQAADAATRSC